MPFVRKALTLLAALMLSSATTLGGSTSHVSAASETGGPFHGTWAGTSLVTCLFNNAQMTTVRSNPSTWSVTQNGSMLSGMIQLEDAAVGRSCAIRSVVLPLSAIASGTGFNGTVVAPEGFSIPISGSLRDGILTARLFPEEGSVEFTLSQSGAAPRAGLVGKWSGTFTDTITTSQCGPASSSGEMVATFFQDGDRVSVHGVLFGIRKPCENRLKDESFSETLRLSGNRLSATSVYPHESGRGESRSVLNAVVTGSTITGTVEYSSPIDRGTTTFTLSNASAMPEIRSFTATPEVTRAGETVSLLWSTLNASTVMIDNGVGNQPAAGSVRVSPGSTTTYTLTAMSAAGERTSATVTVSVTANAAVSVSTLPSGMLQLAGESGSTDRYVLVNNGGATANVNLSQTGDFFTQSPTQFSLAPGASREIVITASGKPEGSYVGSSNPSGNGVPAGLTIPIKLLVDRPPVGTTNVTPVGNRVDTSGTSAAAISATARFANSGTATVDALVVADQPWIVPQSAAVSIPPNSSIEVAFTIDPARRRDAADPVGSSFGNLTLRFIRGTSGSGAKISVLNSPPSSSTSITVIHTVAPVTAASEPPRLAPGEVAIFLPGMGHVTGSVGVFLSDLTLLNRSSAPIHDLRMFFTPLSGAAAFSASIRQLNGNDPLVFADVVKSVFKFDAHNGSMQIRTRQADNISLAANVFNSSDPKGTYGTVIPAFRSDRAVAPGGSIYLTGLRADATSHTNLYIQEVHGAPVSARVDFYDANGGSVGAPQTHTLEGFKLIQLGRVVPEGAVSAIVTSDPGSVGHFVAYATPVDRASGDTWAVADWARLGGFSMSEPLLIPVAGAAPGANNTYFRTDLAVMNSGTTQASATLTYYTRSGEKFDRRVEIAPRSTSIMNDVVTTLFNVSTPSVGFILLTPESGNVVASSRTYTTVGGSAATFGTGVATMSVASSLRAGQMRQFGGIEDSALETIQRARPGTFRTNIGMIETSGEAVTVRVTVRYTHVVSASQAAAFAASSKEYELAPRQFLQLSRVTSELIGSARDSSFGDLRGLRVDFEVVRGAGAVVVFTSSIDNGTGDSTTRTE